MDLPLIGVISPTMQHVQSVMITVIEGFDNC